MFPRNSPIDAISADSSGRIRDPLGYLAIFVRVRWYDSSRSRVTHCSDASLRSRQPRIPSHACMRPLSRHGCFGSTASALLYSSPANRSSTSITGSPLFSTSLALYAMVFIRLFINSWRVLRPRSHGKRFVSKVAPRCPPALLHIAGALS